MQKAPAQFILAIMVATFLAAVPLVSAQGGTGLDQANTRARDNATAREMRAQQRAESSPSAGLRRSCEARQAAITNHMSGVVRLAANMLAVFESHSDRVQNFYTTKVIPAGLTVPNYDDLLADIAANEAVVQTTLATAQANADDFSCDTDQIRSHFTAFRTDMQAVKSALHDYRTSIKNLIVAVSRVAEDLPDDEPVASPSPTPSPSPSI